MERLELFAKWTLRVSIIVSLVYTLKIGHWVGTSGGTIILFATFLVDYVNKRYYKIDSLIIIVVYIFCLFSLVLGNMWDFYDKLVWWDLLMHILSGVILGIIGNLIFINMMGKCGLHVMVRFLFIVGIACLGGVIWEIYEFTIDSLFNLDTQLSKINGISDTMWDLITDLIGGSGIAIACTIYDKKKLK